MSALCWIGFDAALVYDGSHLVLPPSFRPANPDQFKGTPLENLVEVGGRICYDSAGLPKSRSTVAYHQHIAEVRHGSVWEHPNLTVRVDARPHLDLIGGLLNRPGLWVRLDAECFFLTLNFRALVEWHEWSTQLDNPGFERGSEGLGEALRRVAHPLAPLVIPPPRLETKLELQVVEPETDEECWISLWLSESRGNAHEQVRHKFRTSVSQRSTRFVQESESPYVLHPLLSELMAEDKGGEEVAGLLEGAVRADREVYDELVERLKTFLGGRGVDKFSARKQAFGAARAVLGTALRTELLFSASVAQWRCMLKARAADAADAEIRNLYAGPVLEALRKSRYVSRFADMRVEPASDGLGLRVVAAEVGQDRRAHM